MMTEGEIAEETKRVEPYSPSDNAVDISPDKDGGVLKEIRKDGSGDEKPACGDQVSVHYVGFLPDGEVFDSSRDRGEYFEFTLGRGNVIKAWDIGIASMRKGEKCILYCKSEYAYGERGSLPKIPPNATLVFEVELFSWTGEDISEAKDGGILRHLITEGEGTDYPQDGANVEVALIGRYNGRVFEERTVNFVIGEGFEQNIATGVEKSLEHAKKGQRSNIKLTSQYAFDEEGRPDLNIPPNAEVEYDVTLINFQQAKKTWEMSDAEKLEKAGIYKEKGTNSFKQGKYKSAIKFYEKTLRMLEHEPGLEGNEDSKQLQVAAHLNMTMCYLKDEEFAEAVQRANYALDLDKGNEKGIFRRGLAKLGLNDYELAKGDFETVLKIDPGNKAAANQIVICNQKIKIQNEKDKKLYSNMFRKFSEPDNKKVEETPPAEEPNKPMEETA
jgi:FKBP-type peptidyl-prolyl cis-trans isomerase